MKRLFAAVCSVALVLPFAVAAKAPPSSVIRYKPSSDESDERPTATEIAVAPQGSDFAFRVVFDKAPWGEECKNRCANTTVFVDTDDNRATGLQLGGSAAETGADLAITLQGSRDYGDGTSRAIFKAKVKYLPDGAKSLDDGEALGELDPQNDSDRFLVEDRTVYVLVDGTLSNLPSGKKARVVYHPPGAKALTSSIKGMLGGGGGEKVEIFRKGVKGGGK